jgi:O-antigen/teichoic acid export membrane protein
MSGGFFRNAALLSGAEIFARLKGLAFLPILTRHLGTADFGSWAQVGILVALVLPCMMLATESGAIRYLSGCDRAEASRRFTSWLWFLAATGVAVTALLAMLRAPVAGFLFGDSTHTSIVLLACASVWISAYTAAARTWARVHNRAEALAVFTALQALTSLAGLAMALLASADVERLVAYLLLGDAAALVAMAVWIWWDGAIARPDFAWLPGLLRFSLPLLPGAYAYWGLNFIDRFFLVHYSGLEAVGAYTLVYSLAYIVIQVVVSPLWAMFPNLATEAFNNGERDAVQTLFERSAGAIFLVGAPAVAGSFIVSEDVVRLIGGEAYTIAAGAMPWLLTAYLLLMLTAYYDVAAGLRGRPVLCTYGLIIGFILNVVLNALLVPKYGIMGAAWATAAGFLVQFIFMYAVHRADRLLSIAPAFVLRTVTISASMAAVLGVLKPLFDLPFVVSLPLTISSGIVFYVVGARVLRVVPERHLSGFWNLSAIRAWKKRRRAVQEEIH